jgi:hypothetical protein
LVTPLLELVVEDEDVSVVPIYFLPFLFLATSKTESFLGGKEVIF